MRVLALAALIIIGAGCFTPGASERAEEIRATTYERFRLRVEDDPHFAALPCGRQCVREADECKGRVWSRGWTYTLGSDGIAMNQVDQVVCEEWRRGCLSGCTEKQWED